VGEVISLEERRRARRPRRGEPVRAELLFDLACPFTYLVAERVERAFDHVRWTPASTTALRCGSLASEPPNASDSLKPISVFDSS
jgi:hypothetical protein